MNVENRTLLIIGVVEEIEGFRFEAQGKTLAQVNVSSNTEVEIVRARAREGIKPFARNHPVIQLRSIKDGGVWPAARHVQNSRKNKMAQEPRGGGPAAVENESVALVEL